MTDEKKENWPKAPDNFSQKAKVLYSEYVGTVIRAPAAIALLVAGLESFDRMNEARSLVRKEGLTTKTGKSGVLHVHPALAIEKEAKAQFIRIWRTLGLQKNFGWAEKVSYTFNIDEIFGMKKGEDTKNS